MHIQNKQKYILFLICCTSLLGEKYFPYCFAICEATICINIRKEWSNNKCLIPHIPSYLEFRFSSPFLDCDASDDTEQRLVSTFVSVSLSCLTEPLLQTGIMKSFVDSDFLALDTHCLLLIILQKMVTSPVALCQSCHQTRNSPQPTIQGSVKSTWPILRYIKPDHQFVHDNLNILCKISHEKIPWYSYIM